jgi:AAA15 family ATPase/GTPase
MLNELRIINFRLFEYLKLEGLKRVNLFAGKNNSGKTALLEALRILAANGDATVINHIIALRGQFTPGWKESYDSLFPRNALLSNSAPSINLNINNVTIKREKSTGMVSPDFKIVGRLLGYDMNPNASPDFPNDKAVYVPLGNAGFFPLQKMWDNIVLTELENKVLGILRETILPGLNRLDVNEDRTLVRLDSEKKPIPLKNLGDGAQRMLLLSIALVSSKDKILLIDEIENGLHYSVMEDLWAIIFKYAEDLNVQVFVTTHSSDALKTFAYVLERPENKGKGVYFRLQKARKTDQIEAIPYDLDELELSLEADLEPR